jgi:hypothetical protein
LSCIALPNSFLAVRSASGPVFMFCAPGLVVGGTEGVRSRFMFCGSGIIFGGTEGVGSRFPILRARTRFQRCRVRRVPFSCFVLPESFSAVPRASGPVFMFCALGLVFGGNEGVAFLFHVLRVRTRFRRYRGRRVPFSCLCAQTRFPRHRERRAPLTSFALPDSFSTVARASGPVFMFCAPRLIFGGIVGVRSRFHVFRVRNHFRRYRGRRVPLSSFALPNSFSAVPGASVPVFMLCAP